MRVIVFCHSLISDWNHGNAHFLRGITSELLRAGHEVHVYEPVDAWSVRNLVSEHGAEPIARFEAAYPHLRSIRFEPSQLRLDDVLADADLVLVHEWNDPSLVARIGAHRAHNGSYALMFHDTHHRSVTDPESMSRYDLRHYDGVLAFGQSVADVYRTKGWAERVWVWHEAAHTDVFRPIARDKEGALVWIGNWGDGERTAELQEYLIEPVKRLGLRSVIHGVRYPQEALDALDAAGIEYRGWTPNFEAPNIFSRFRVTVHVPRGPYAAALPGVPTIRVFEALACGIPLVSAPWSDSENLFTPGADFLVARSGSEMKQHLRTLLNEPDTASGIADRGRKTVLERHTCRHRVEELMGIYEELRQEAATLVGGAAH